MSRFKTVARVTAFLLVFAAALLSIQELVTPDYNWPEYDDRLGNAVRGLYREPDDSLQVLWLGTSHMRNGVSPLVVYRESGIRSYNLASPSQTVGVAYERLREAFRHQSPKVVLVDTSFCFYSAGFNKNEVSWRKIVDSLHWSRFAEKYRIMRGLTDARKESPLETLDGVLPIVRYHTHYLLNASDYVNDNAEALCLTKGYGFSARTKPVEDFDDDVLETFSAEEASKTNSKIVSREKMKKYLAYDYGYLEKMVALCREHDCELVLTKVPVHARPEKFQSYWSREKHDMIAEAAERLGCRFLDLHYEDVGLDWSKDSKDSGHHLNTYGAIKVSRFYAKWLLENCDLDPAVSDAVSSSWDRQLSVYGKEEACFTLKLEQNIDAYLDILRDGDYTVFVAVSGTVGEHFTPQLREKLASLTGAGQIPDPGVGEDAGAAYLLVSLDGATLKEKKDAQTCAAKGKLKDGTAYRLESNGLAKGAGCSIRIGNVNFKSKENGIMLVAYDNQLGCAVDCVTFDTGREDAPPKRPTGVGYNVLKQALTEYEKTALKGL